MVIALKKKLSAIPERSNVPVFLRLIEKSRAVVRSDPVKATTGSEMFMKLIPMTNPRPTANDAPEDTPST